MSIRFDCVTVKEEKYPKAKIIFYQQLFDPNMGHTAVATVSGSTLTVTVTIGQDTYQRVIRGVDVQADVKLTPNRGHVSVKVIKNTEFDMNDKLKQDEDTV